MEDQIGIVKNWLGTGSLNIFGRPFAGKDTQGHALAVLFGGEMISSGEILRSAEGQPELQHILAAGGIPPSDIFLRIVVPFLRRTELNGKPLILSEVGRMVGEDEAVMQATAESGHPTKAVIHLQITDREIFERFDTAQFGLNRGHRADDNRDVLQTRLDKYHKIVLPVIDAYRRRGLLVEVDGTQPREDVTAEIISLLAVHAQV